MKKKIALIALAVTAVLFTACAAENTPSAVSQQESSSAVSSEDKTTALTEEAAKETVKLNMPIADKFFAIYNRCSLPVDKSVSVTDGNGFTYSPVESVYDTIDSLKEDTEKYFTKEYLESTFYKNLANETAFYKDIDGKLYENTDAVSDGKNIWDTTACVITELTDTGFTATVPYLDLYEAHRSARIEYVLDNGSYKINKWEMNLDAGV
ncbi:MAG: hypothetical protein ACI4JV_11270 [Ruminiclostridium sp.]